MSDNFGNGNDRSGGGGGGCGTIGIFNLLAAFISYKMGNSLGLVVLHTLLGVFYLFYVCLGFGGSDQYDSFWAMWDSPAIEERAP